MIDDDTPAGIVCARCGRLAPITVGDLRAESGLPVPDLWSPLNLEPTPPDVDLDDDAAMDDEVSLVEFDYERIVCSDCAKPHEVAAWLRVGLDAHEHMLPEGDDD